MNVLSVFDGISCAQVALQRAGIHVDQYFASEIDKYAIKITQANHPNTIQLGDVTQVKANDLPPINLLIGGSPCQGFSFAGKQLNFNDERSKLFFEFVRLKNELNPKYFLLENVFMKQEYQDVISEYLGVQPILINSSLVSAQIRKRLYWTNIPNVTQPEDKHIYLKDIIDYDLVDVEKAFCITSNYWKGTNQRYYLEKNARQICFIDRGFGYMPSSEKAHIDRSWLQSFSKQEVIDMFGYRILTPIEVERLQTLPESYTNHVSNTQRYKALGNGFTVDVITHILKTMKN